MAARKKVKQTLKSHAVDTALPEDRLLDTNGAASYLGLHPVTVQKLRTENRGPAYIRVEGSVRYRLQDLRDYTMQQRVSTVSQA